MLSVDRAILELRELDLIARGDRVVHRLDPRAKVLATACVVVTVVSFPRYEVAALLPFAAFPILLAAAGGVPFGLLLRKAALALPFALVVGAANPIVDRDPLVALGSWTVSGGWCSLASIVLRFLITVTSALALVGTTSFDGVCAALTRLGAPRVLVAQLLLLYRYIFLLAEQAARMLHARDLRRFGARDKGAGAAGAISLVGHLLLRTSDRAQRVHTAMSCRGFDGSVRVAPARRPGLVDALVPLTVLALCVTLRGPGLAHRLGRWILELLS